jgi:hypothetical protein
MAGNSSDVSLASNALLLLGHRAIASFEDSDSGAEVASNLFEHSYKSILSLHRWRFATKQCELSRLAASPKSVYKYQFQLPADLIYVIRAIGIEDYEIYHEQLYCNSIEVYIEYIYDIDSSYLPSYFAKMFEFYLASQFAIPITGDIDKASYYTQQYEKALVRAKFADSSQRPNDAFSYNPYVDVRQ